METNLKLVKNKNYLEAKQSLQCIILQGRGEGGAPKSLSCFLQHSAVLFQGTSMAADEPKPTTLNIDGKRAELKVPKHAKDRKKNKPRQIKMIWPRPQIKSLVYV